MSFLADALLLDPYPFETWIAYRSDGSTGSGTLNDPWNAAPKLGTAVQITVLTNDGQEATATAPGHALTNGDVVVISGVTGDGAAQWNGVFPIYGVSGNQFKYYMTAVPADSAELSAASVASKVTAFPFDDVMSALPESARVHLGPTPAGQPFLTRGYADGVGGWQAKAGMKICGSGIDVTTLKLVPAASANAHFFAVGHALATGLLKRHSRSIGLIPELSRGSPTLSIFGRKWWSKTSWPDSRIRPGQSRHGPEEAGDLLQVLAVRVASAFLPIREGAWILGGQFFCVRFMSGGLQFQTCCFG